METFLEKSWDWFVKKSGLVNNTLWNRHHWRKYLEKEKNKTSGLVGFDWGNPESSDDYYGNYKQVLDWLLANITKETRVVEIGSLGGKWTQYMSKARQVTCVDLFEEAFVFLKERLGEQVSLNFYKTKGNELKGIPSHSVDIVFSMDALPRVPKKSIQKYFFEMFRILKKGGKVFIHLPCSDIPFCRRKAFTPISENWIRDHFEKSGFESYQLHSDWVKHGVILIAEKK